MIVSTVLAHGRSYEARASRREQRKRLGSTSECPDIADCDSVGKHRAVAIELELVEKRDHSECNGPAQTYSDIRNRNAKVIETQRAAWTCNDCPHKARYSSKRMERIAGSGLFAEPKPSH